MIYVVTLNGEESKPTEIEADSSEEAITKTIQKTKSLRDRRNFTAIPKGQAERIESGKAPKIKTS